MRNALGTLVCVSLLSAACSDRISSPVGEVRPATVTIAASFSIAAGGIAEAYARADRLQLRFLSGDEVRLEQELAFDPSGSETIVPLEVPMRAVNETLTFELELRAASAPIFRASGSAQLTSGLGRNVNVTLVPVVAGVACAGDVVTLDAYGATSTVPGAATFATGDSIPDATVEWSVGGGGVAAVDDAGTVTALQDGEAVVTCRAGTFTDTRTVRVFAVVDSITVSPPTATTLVGSTVAFAATLRDARGNIITTPRPVSWTTADGAVAQVSQTGLASGVAPGTIALVATSGAASGAAMITVIYPPPVAQTRPATDAGRASAVLNGVVDPSGAPTEAWFEWGTDPSLVSSTATPAQPVGNGHGDVAVARELGGLLPNATYFFRIVARSDGGLVNGEILSFSTLAPPTVLTEDAEVGRNSAVLHGTVNPEGAATQAWFEWGATPALGTFETTAVQPVGDGRTAVAVTAALANLTAGATYYYRQAASNAAGGAEGSIVAFTVPRPPTAETGVADVGPRSAVLHATVNPHGSVTEAWFEWSTSPSLAGAQLTAVQAIGSGVTPVEISAALSGLADGATYWYRVVASNIAGDGVGEVVSFTTPRPPVAVTAPATITSQDVDPGICTTLCPTFVLSAVLNGTVNPGGLPTEAWYELTTSTPGTFTPTERRAVGSGSAAVAFNETLSNLPSGTTFFARLVAANALGTSTGELVQITTPGGRPVVRTDSTTWTVLTNDPRTFRAYISGVVMPNGATTQAWLEYSTDPEFATFTRTTEQTVPASYDETHYDRTFVVGADAQGNAPIMYFRAAASNLVGTSRSPAIRVGRVSVVNLKAAGQ